MNNDPKALTMAHPHPAAIHRRPSSASSQCPHPPVMSWSPFVIHLFLPFLLLLLPCMIDAFQKCQPLVLNHLSPSSTLFQPPTVNDCACLASCQFRLIFISLCDTICTKNLITWYKCFCFVGPNEILHSKYEPLAWFFRILCFFKCTTNPENDSLSRCFSATRV